MTDSELSKRLLDERNIIAWTYAYATALDSKAFDDLGALFTDDIQTDYGGYQCDGMGEVLHMVVSHLAGCGPTQHLFSNHRINIQGDTAEVAFYANIMHAGLGDQSDTLLTIWSEYSGVFLRDGQGWRASRFNQNPIKMQGDMSILQGPQ